MKYRDLIQFDPITTIVQLTDSGVADKAKKLVSSYVISETMQAQLTETVFKQLDPSSPEEKKGLLIVGNYGTGKSHLMSFISAVASDAARVGDIQNAAVKAAAPKIAGKFNVICDEIGGVQTKFRDIIVNLLQKHLDANAVAYSIPVDDTKLTNNKGWFAEMMDAYHAKFPNKGILLVIDEMLDYLRSLGEKELVLALGVMRELGEFANARDARGQLYGFHFIGGVQEAIFDSGRFAFVSDSLGRVAERFKQVKIDRTDVKFVISERLLKKTPTQLAQVEAHLGKFSKCYEEMTPRLDEFKRMFPVHPDFVAVFEQINCVEKRRVLDTLSAKMSAILDKDVPSDEPGLIAFDSYWTNVEQDQTTRANADTKGVIDVVSQLNGKIDHGGLGKLYIPMAHRLVNALAVHRLSQDAIDSHIGLTASEFREMLFVYDAACAEEANPAEALAEQIQVVMKKLMMAVDGQYITKNPANDQYYIDVKKTVDVEQMIEKKADGLDDEKLDRAYFSALSVLLEVIDVSTYVPGFKIWEYSDIRWFSHKTFRRGYLFFGAPNERSTAQPPRDYYLYFLKPFTGTAFRDNKNADEVFFKLTSVDAELKKLLGNYAAATELRDTNTGALKAAFDGRVRENLQKIVCWMREKGLDAFKVTYRGEQKKTSDWLAGVDVRSLMGIDPNETLNYRDQVHALCGHLLEGCFTEQAPDYPVFSKFISAEARKGAVADSLRVVAGTGSKQGVVLLDGLKLLDGSGNVTIENSPYATKVEAKLVAAGEGKVVNKDDLLEKDATGNVYFDPSKSRLEPELLVLTLAAMVQQGKSVLSIPGKEFGAPQLDELAHADLDDLTNFKHIARPKGGNTDGLQAAFKLVELPVAWAAQVQLLKSDPVLKLQTAVLERINTAARLQPRLGRGISFLAVDLLAQCGVADAVSRVKQGKDLLEKIRGFDTAAKLLAMPYTKQEIEAQAENVKLIGLLDKIAASCDRQLPVITYFDKAADNCPPDDAWRAKKSQSYAAIKASVVTVTKVAELSKTLADTETKFAELEAEWKKHYAALHKKARLGDGCDVKKQQVKNSIVLKKLSDLSVIEILPKKDLENLVAQLSAMTICKDFKEDYLRSSALCPDCCYSPKNDGTGTDAQAVLNGMPELLEQMLVNWTALILTNLAAPQVKANFSLLSKDERDAINEFIADKSFPTPIPLPLLSGLKKALGGLEKLVVKIGDLGAKLKALGPAEPAQVQTAVNDFFDKLLNGKELEKVRIVVE